MKKVLKKGKESKVYQENEHIHLFSGSEGPLLKSVQEWGKLFSPVFQRDTLLNLFYILTAGQPGKLDNDPNLWQNN